MAKSNKDDIVNGILEYKLIESVVQLGSAAKEDARRRGVKPDPPGAEIIRAFATPRPTWYQWINRIGWIILPVLWAIGLYVTFHGL